MICGFVNKTYIKTTLLRLLKTEVIFLNTKDPELLYWDCDSVCVNVSVRYFMFSWDTWSLFRILHTFTFIPMQHVSLTMKPVPCEVWFSSWSHSHSIPSPPSLLHSPYPNSTLFYLPNEPSYASFCSELTPLCFYLHSTTYPIPCHSTPCHSTPNLFDSKHNDLPNSEFLVCLWVISGCNPLCNFTEPSGAWEVPF